MPSIANGELGPKNGASNLVTVYARAIGFVGIPGAIAIILVWIMASEIPKITRQTETNHAAILINRENISRLAAQTEEQLRLMRWICAGVQKNDADRRNCFEK